jgi:CRISPR-associated protein Cas2
MPMTIVVTRNVPGRFRGFLASAMCEIAPGVYTAPRMSAGVRERVWSVLESWYQPDEPDRSVLMTWPERTLPGGQEIRTLGIPQHQLCSHYGVYLAKRAMNEPARKRLERPAPAPEADGA